MTAVLAIDDAHTRSRFLGPVEDAADIRRRLDALIAGPVCDTLSAKLAARLHEGALLRIGDLHVRLRLTRAQLETARAADLWSDAILSALDRALAEGAAQIYGSQLEYQAAYVRVRFGDDTSRSAFFAEFAAFDHLSALQALAELLAHTPALWTQLAPDGPAAVRRFVQRISAQGGQGAFTYLLRVIEYSQTDPDTGFPCTPADCAVLANRLAGLDLQSNDDGSAFPPLARIVFLALLLAKIEDPAPTRLAALVVFLSEVTSRRAGGPVSVDDLVRHEAPPPFAPGLRRVAARAQSTPDFARALQELADQISGLSETATEPATRAGSRQGESVAARPEAPDPSPARLRSRSATRSTTEARHYRAPFAGVGLVFRHLCEEDLGAALPVKVRLDALASLVRSELYPDPQGADFLKAIAGADQDHEVPARPGPEDMFFIPRDKRESVLSMPPGAARLARWLALRFAAGLPGLQSSSLKFLQGQFFHIPGEMWVDDTEIRVRIDHLPLCPVLQLAGRMEVERDPPRVGWLSGQRLVVTVDAEATG